MVLSLCIVIAFNQYCQPQTLCTDLLPYFGAVDTLLQMLHVEGMDDIPPLLTMNVYCLAPKKLLLDAWSEQEYWACSYTRIGGKQNWKTSMVWSFEELLIPKSKDSLTISLSDCIIELHQAKSNSTPIK